MGDLQQEVIAAIDYDKLIKVSYGDGGGRKMVLFSAVDCGFCQRFEQDLMKKGSGVNTTFYVVPMSLQAFSGAGVAKWQTVSRIWCADNSSAAWRKYWTRRRTMSTIHSSPPPRRRASSRRRKSR